MTTIAYDGKRLVADSQALHGGTIKQTIFQKIKVIDNDNLVGGNEDEILAYCMSGCPYTFMEMFHRVLRSSIAITPFNLHRAIEPPQYGMDNDLYWGCLVLTVKKEVYHITSEAPGFIKVDYPHAIGSGCDYAKAALSIELDAIKAIQVASKLDPYTNLPYSIYYIESGEFYPAS